MKSKTITPMQALHDPHAACPATTEALLLEAIRLWSEPDEAPEVPPETVLRRFLAAPETLTPDLVEQIRRSINCARALERLRRATVAEPAAFDAAFLARLRQAMPAAGSRAASGSPADAAGAPPVDGPRPAAAQIWTTGSRVEHWSGERFGWRWTFRPPTVVLVDDGREMPWDDTVFRAVPLTPEPLWPSHMVAEDEVTLAVPGAGTFVAHLWLNYPVSACQLAACLGTLPEREREVLDVGLAAVAEGLPLMPADRAGAPLDPRFDSDTLLERERLHACAAWLPATADSRREWWETRIGKYAEQPIPFPERAVIRWTRKRASPQPEESVTALAALDACIVPNATAVYAVATCAVTVQVTLETDGAHCAFLVLDATGTPSPALDGAVVCTPCGVSEPFQRGHARLAVRHVADGFRIRRPDGTFAELSAEGEMA